MDKKKLEKDVKKMWIYLFLAYLASFVTLGYSAITESWIRFFVGIIFFIVTALFNIGLIELENKHK